MESVLAESQFPLEIVTIFGVLLAIPLLLISIVYYAPGIRLTYPESPKARIRDLQRKYRFTQVWSTIVWLGFMAAIVVGIVYFLVAMMSYILQPEADDIVFGRMPTSSLILLAFFVAFFVAVAPTLFVLRFVLGQVRYAEFVELNNLHVGCNLPRLLPYLIAITILVGAATAVLAVDCFFRLKPDRIEVNHFLTIGTKVCPVQSVRRLVLVRSYRAPSGLIVSNAPFMRLETNDGYEFSSRFAAFSFYEPRDFASIPMFEAAQESKERNVKAIRRALESISDSAGIPVELEDAVPPGQ